MHFPGASILDEARLENLLFMLHESKPIPMNDTRVRTSFNRVSKDRDTIKLQQGDKYSMNRKDFMEIFVPALAVIGVIERVSTSGRNVKFIFPDNGTVYQRDIDHHLAELPDDRELLVKKLAELVAEFDKED